MYFGYKIGVDENGDPAGYIAFPAEGVSNAVLVSYNGEYMA